VADVDAGSTFIWGAGDAVSIALSGGSVKLAKAALGDNGVKNGFRKELIAKKARL
jgi:hypothetical protein